MFSVKKMTTLSKQWSEDFSWDPDNLIKLSYYPSKWSQSPFWVQSSLNRLRLSVCPATGVPAKISRKWVNFQYCDWELTKDRMFASDCFALTHDMCLITTSVGRHCKCLFTWQFHTEWKWDAKKRDCSMMFFLLP